MKKTKWYDLCENSGINEKEVLVEFFDFEVNVCVNTEKQWSRRGMQRGMYLRHLKALSGSTCIVTAVQQTY